MQINEFVANDRITEELSRTMASGELPHAIIIDGAKGTGKRTLADILSRYCVCTADENRPCGKCSACVKALHGNHPDISISDGDKTGELSVDAVRRIRADAFIMPNEAPMKAYILQNCDKMLPAAQNAFLKVLEEPPANVVFIMTVTSANMLLQTVRSRARLYSLFPPSPEEAAEYAAGLYPERDKGELLQLSQLCDGNIGKIISTIENDDQEAAMLAQEIISAVTRSTEYDLLVLTNRMCRDRAFAASVLDSLSELSSEALRCSLGLSAGPDVVMQLSKRLTKKRICMLTEAVGRAKTVLACNVNMNFFGTWLSSVLRV